MILGKLYKMGRATLILRLLNENEITLVVMEVQEGVWESHVGGRVLVNKILRDGYYRPTWLRDITEFVDNYDNFK